jgi:negative regulator of sigma E activity
MSTASITHRPIPMAAAVAAVVAACAFGVVAVSQNISDSPAQSQKPPKPDPPVKGDHWQPTTSGGRTVAGMP